MNTNEMLTLGGIVLSPIFAVGLTLWVESRRRKRDGQMIVVRALLATRHLPSDPSFSTAINLIRAEFSDCPAVMAAFKAYHQTVRREDPNTDSGKQLFDADVQAATTKLLSAVLAAVGMAASEADLAVEGYAARGMLARDNLFLASLDAQVRTANALEKSLDNG